MKHFSGKEKKELKSILPKGYEVDKKDEIIIDDRNVVSKNGISFMIFKDEKYLPHLSSIPQTQDPESDNIGFPNIYIDKGAIPFLLKGADMMRPGIQIISGEFDKGDVVVIRDENHNKALGIGFAILNSDDMKKSTAGKSVEIYHYVNDSYY